MELRETQVDCLNASCPNHLFADKRTVCGLKKITIGEAGRCNKGNAAVYRRGDIETAFTMGFLISREGFNADCAYEHCAPSDGITIREMIDGSHVLSRGEVEQCGAFVQLRDKIIKWMGA